MELIDSMHYYELNDILILRKKKYMKELGSVLELDSGLLARHSSETVSRSGTNKIGSKLELDRKLEPLYRSGFGHGSDL